MTENKSYCVYMHTTPSGKKYIGITRKVPEKRWLGGYGYRQNHHFYSAIQKYGWDNISHDILADGLSKEEACLLEKKFIKALKSNDKQYGYNKSVGGENPAEGAHWKLSEETRKRQSEAQRGRKWSDESRARQGIKLKRYYATHESPNKNVPLSKETREKISKSLIEWNREHESPNRGRHYKKSPEAIRRTSEGHMKKIVCIEVNIVYPSIQIAEILTGIDGSSISKVCRGKRETAGGYHWVYLDDG